MLGTTLTIIIPLMVFGYGIWLLIRMLRRRKAGGCSSCSCGSCPYAGSCHPAEGCRLNEGEKKRD